VVGRILQPPDNCQARMPEDELAELRFNAHAAPLTVTATLAQWPPHQERRQLVRAVCRRPTAAPANAVRP
jgi:hypothetical protein